MAERGGQRPDAASGGGGRDRTGHLLYIFPSMRPFVPEFRSSGLSGGLPLLSLLFLLVLPGSMPAAELHDFDDLGCEACHRDVDGEPGDLLDGIDARCRSCHQPCPSGRKHGGSKGTSSAMAVPMPLGRGEVIGCHTCHDPHGEGVVQGTAMRSRLLRLDNRSRGLCLNCHRSGGRTGR